MEPLENLSVHAWWYFLLVAAAVNVGGWVLSAHALAHRQTNLPADVHATRKQMLILAGIYVLGCAFRSVFPMIDVPRFCLHDTWVSRVVIGRSVATVAELAFAAQWALLLNEAGARRAARWVLPLIAIAELCSWVAVLSTSDLLHVAEHVLWTITTSFAMFFLATRWSQESKYGRHVIIASAACTIAYVAFMLSYVLPLYFERWQANFVATDAVFSVTQGVSTLLARCVVEHDWALWWRDAAWLTPYFTFAVWISLALPHMPSLRPGTKSGSA